MDLDGALIQVEGVWMCLGGMREALFSLGFTMCVRAVVIKESTWGTPLVLDVCWVGHVRHAFVDESVSCHVLWVVSCHCGVTEPS